MGSEQLNLKILMKKFLSEEKEYIKFVNKDQRDIILFEKENFYIHANTLCGIESRKKERYNVGDIYLFLCLPKSNYTFSYINSVGYKYISILEKSKIIKFIEDNEDNDEIKVNFFVYDLKKILNLHDYVDVEDKDQGIQVDLFHLDVVGDVDRDSEHGNERGNEKGYVKGTATKGSSAKDATTGGKQKDGEGETFSPGHRKRKREGAELQEREGAQTGVHTKPSYHEKSSSHLDKGNANPVAKENFVSFDSVRTVCDTEKMDNSIILYVAKGSPESRHILSKIDPWERMGDYNFLQRDIPSQEYDPLIYFNCNEVNALEEIGNDASNNYDFFRVEVTDPTNMKDHSGGNSPIESPPTGEEVPIEDATQVGNLHDGKNKTAKNQSGEKDGENKSNHHEDTPDSSLQNMIKHYFGKDNFFKNVFLQNVNLYSVLKNTYFSNTKNERQIDQCVKLIVDKFHRDYIKFMESEQHMVLSTCNDFLRRYSKHNYTHIYQKGDLYKNFADFDMLDLDLSINEYNEEGKHSTNQFNDQSNVHSQNGPSVDVEDAKFLVGQFIPLEIVQNFNDHDKIIFFHDLLAQYVRALGDKQCYNANRALVNFVHNFVNDFSLKENLYWGVNAERGCPLPPEEFVLSDPEDFLFDLVQHEAVTTGGDAVPVDGKDDQKNKSPFTQKNNCAVVRSKLDRKTISKMKLTDEQVIANEEITKSVLLKEVNMQDAYDQIGKNANDFSRIYNLFERELLNKSNIKNVYINGIKKNIIIDDGHMKTRVEKKSLKLIDEIHLTYKKRPIILIEKESSNHIINRNNVESFFVHNRLDNSGPSRKGTHVTGGGGDGAAGPYNSIPIIYKMFNKKKA